MFVGDGDDDGERLSQRSDDVAVRRDDDDKTVIAVRRRRRRRPPSPSATRVFVIVACVFEAHACSCRLCAQLATRESSAGVVSFARVCARQRAAAARRCRAPLPRAAASRRCRTMASRLVSLRLGLTRTSISRGNRPPLRPVVCERVAYAPVEPDAFVVDDRAMKLPIW